MANPPNTGNLFKKPFPLADKGNNSENRPPEREQGFSSNGMAPPSGYSTQPAPLSGYSTQPATPSSPGMVPPSGYSAQPAMPSSAGMAPPSGYSAQPATPSSANMAPPSGYATQPATPSSAGMGYMSVPTATIDRAPQPTVPAATNNNTQPKPKKGLVKRVRARYNALPKRSKIILAILAVCMLFPTSIIILEAITAVTIYSQAKSGVQHIMNVKNLFTGSGGHASSLLDVNKLNQAEDELKAAHADFLQLSNNLDQDGTISLAGGLFPQQIQTIRSLSHIGVDATEIGSHLIGTGKTIAPIFRTPIMSSPPPANTNEPNANPPNPNTASNNKPLITQDVMNLFKADIDYMLPHLDHMIPYTRNLDLGILPVSDQQKQQIGTLLQILPQARNDLAQAEGFMGAISWVIGVDKPRTFLIQTMDRAELRAGGGFTGQFGILNLNGGHMAPFALQNIGPIEEHNPTAATNGNTPPVPFTWWPIANFGLRDSNISADFPTSAKISIDLAKLEFQEDVDGVVVFSPFLISHILEITGPITIPKYNETITAQNLEARLHFYQLDNAGIYKEMQVENVQDKDQARKLFTKALSNILIQHVFKSPPDELLSLGKEMLYAMQTKDLQIYVTNNEIEQLLAKYGSTSQIDTSPDHDGLFIVQANVSVSKASQFVRTSVEDTVTLDADGGATHVMNLRLAYMMQGAIYGWDYYRDYVRIYVPANSQLLSGNGFDANYRGYCGANAGRMACQPDVFGDGTLICPPNVDAGAGVSMIGDPYGLDNHPVDLVGPPTNTESDMPGRAMYGGWVNIPKNCTLNIALSWHVPPQGNNPYSLMYQRQSSTFPDLDLTILPTPGNCTQLQTAGLHFHGVMSGADTLFTPPKMQGGSSCYPDNKV